MTSLHMLHDQFVNACAQHPQELPPAVKTYSFTTTQKKISADITI